MTKVVIVGAGPTGASLALLLAQRGIAVTLVEVAKDFRRTFRGEGLMPSGLDALTQMGLGDLLETLPTSPLTAWEFIISGKSLFRVDEPMGGDRPCTLIAQPPLLNALVTQAQTYPNFEFIQGTGVKDVLWSPKGSSSQRVSGVRLTDGRMISAGLVIGADGRNSVIRQRVELELVTEPKSIDVLWFKLPAHPRLTEQNVFYTIVNQRRVFSLFHSAEENQMHLAWVLYPDAAPHHSSVQAHKPDAPESSSPEWGETFASLAPDWLAEHFREYSNAIASPIRLSVIVGRCPSWHKPGVLLLGDAAHPMSPVRAQGINMALRDAIVAANHLVPVLTAGTLSATDQNTQLDRAIAAIQDDREPEIIKAQKLQAAEAKRGELLRSNPLAQATIQNFSPILSPLLKRSWVHKQKKLRQGITDVNLKV